MERNIVEKILKITKIEEKESLLNDINQEKDRLISLKNEDSLIRQAIIDFVGIYNPLHSEWKNKTVADFSNKLIPFYDYGKDIATPLLKLMNDTFKNPSAFKVLISFEQQIKKEKAYLECYFKFILLTKNIDNLLFGIKNYLLIEDENLINAMKKIDPESPYSHVLLRNLIENLISEENKLDESRIKKIYKEQIIKIKKYYNFLCPICLQFQFVHYSNGKFTVICKNGHDYTEKVKSVEILQYLSNFVIKCQNCKRILEMYEPNYCCFQCENFLCEECSEKHKNNCLKFSLCKIYDCAFVCREHNKKLVSICSLCEKNLCELCKDVHYHRIPEVDYYSVRNIINSNKEKVFDENTSNSKQLILKQLISSYEFFENYYNIPWFFAQSIFYSVNNKDLTIENSDFFFESFYDNNFIAYYSKLIEQMKKGNMKAVNILKEIRNKYKENNIKINNSFEYQLNSSLNIALVNSNRMIWHLFNLNARLKSLNELIKENELKYGYISSLENNINKLETKIELYKSKILSLFNSTNKYKQGLKLLFDRHLADVIIRILIRKFPEFFCPIQLDFKIAQELIYYFNNKKRTIEKMNLIEKLRDSQFPLETSQFEEVKNADNDDIKSSDNKIKFGYDINKDKVFISQTQLNFLLELLFYTKGKGNQIGHPNIAPEKAIQLKKSDKDFNSIESIFNNCHIDEIDDFSENVLEKNINEKVWNEMKKIKDKFIGNVTDLTTKNQLNISEIMDFMFKGKISAVWIEQTAFLRSILINIDNIINEKCEIDLSSLRKELGKIEDSKEIVEKLSKENIVETFDLNINTNEYKNLKYYITNELKKIQADKKYDSIIQLLKSVDYPKFVNKVYNTTIEAKFSDIYTEHEYMELINHISIPFIINIETKNIEILKSNLINKFQETMILLNIKNKTKKIFQIIQEYLNQDEIDEDYISEVKKFCLEKKDDNYNDIVQLKINLNSVIFYFDTLIGSENISWLKNDKEKGKFSYNTLLYYYQNYNDSN